MEVFDDVRPKVCVRQMVCDFECFDCVCINDVCFHYCQLMFRCLNYTIKNEYLVTSNSMHATTNFIRPILSFNSIYTCRYIPLAIHLFILIFSESRFLCTIFFSICDTQSYTLNLLNGENVDIEHKFYKFYKFSPTQ